MKQIYIDGQFVDSHHSKQISIISPINQEIIGQVPNCNQEDVDDAVKAAKQALESWSSTTLETRIDHAKKFVEALKENKEEIVKTIINELGSPKKFTEQTQFDSYINELDDLLVKVKAFEFVEKREGYDLIKEPVGVVACITPWNYPLGQITKKIIPALLMGNTVILKPSTKTPLVAIKLAEAIDKAGFPAGTFNLLTGKGSKMGQMLTDHPDINMITFTGSTKVGRNVASDALKQMKRITMELGGKSVALILEGADLDVALDKTLSSVYYNSGQTCSALTRLLIPASMKEEIQELIIEKTQEYQVGHPYNQDVEMGPVQSFTQFETVRDYVREGLKEGATMIIGEVPKDVWIKPIVFVDVKNEMKIAQEEIFGPVLCVITYNDVDEAIKIANDSRYGLSGGVFGPDDEAYEVAKQIKTGNVFVNTKDKALNVPFGGYKYSGIGRENGIEGLEEFIELKAVIL